ncbi:retrovirus-related pol polyprotein from transposon TNT 1-94 [Tanacetum coccineum]
MGYIWRPTGRTFTIVGNACPLTRITTTNEVPSRKPIVLESESPKPVVNLVYSRKPLGWNRILSPLAKLRLSKSSSVKFGNDQVAKHNEVSETIRLGMLLFQGFITLKGLGHNLFSVGQFCDSNLEVAFRQHTCFIRNLEGVDLLTGSRGDNLYTLSLGNMMASSPICLLSKASKTKSWLWHRSLIVLLVHLLKSSKKPYKPKSEDTNQEKLYLLHMDLCGPMRVASVNGKKYILVIVDDYSRFTWVKCLRSKDEAQLYYQFLSMIQVRSLRKTVRASEHDAMASEHSSSGPALHDMTPITISSGLVPNPPLSTPFIPPSRSDWDLLFQPMFDESLNPLPYVDLQAPEVIALFFFLEVHISPSNSHTTQETQTPIISHNVEEDNHDIEVAHMGNDPYFAMQEELHEFERLEVWELVPPPDKALVITLKWIYKVKLDELGEKARNTSGTNICRMESIFAASTPELCDLFAKIINMALNLVYPVGTPMWRNPKLERIKERESFRSVNYICMIGTPPLSYIQIGDFEYRRILPLHYLHLPDEDHASCQVIAASTLVALHLVGDGRLKVKATLKSAWTEKDQIDNLLKERRLMRSLEKFVGGRPYGGDLRLLQRTI